MFSPKENYRRVYASGRGFAVGTLLALTALSFFWAAGRVQAAVAKVQALQAVVTEVKGKNVQLSLDEGKSWQGAAKGVKLGQGSLVRTGFASRCEVSFAGHSVVQVEPLSSLRVADYAGTASKQKVRAHLRYGAVRCGVEKGRIKTDTKISTPVSTLSIRGTLVYVEYDAGRRRCLLRVDEDGPALASRVGRRGRPCPDGEPCEEATEKTDPDQATAGAAYVLDEGMHTDCSLSRYLELAVFERKVWITGNYSTGGVSDREAGAIVYESGTLDPTAGALQFNDDRSRAAQRVPEDVIDIPGGGIGIGSHTDE